MAVIVPTGRKIRLFDRFLPRIRSSLELMTMDSHMPGQDNIQERLKTAQEECQRLREENVRLRAMLGIDHSALNEPVSQAVLVPKLSSTGKSGVSTPEHKDRALSKSVSWARRRFRHSVGREEWQIWLFASWRHGLACHPCIETRRAKEGCPQNPDAPATDG